MKKKYLALMMGLTLSLASVGTGAFAQEPAAEAETAAMAEAETAEEENIERISVEDTEQPADAVESGAVEESQDGQDTAVNENVILGEIKEVTEEGIVLAVGEEQLEDSEELTDGEATEEEASLPEEENSAQREEGKVLKLTGEEEMIPVTEDTHIAKAAGEAVILEVQTADENSEEELSEKEDSEAALSEGTEGTETSESISENAAEAGAESAEEDTAENVSENVAENTVEAEETLALTDLEAGDLVKLTLDGDGNAETILVLEQIQAKEGE